MKSEPLTIHVRLYVHREHLHLLEDALKGIVFKYRAPNPLSGQKLVSVHFEEPLSIDRVQRITGRLINNRVPYDVHEVSNTPGSGTISRHARFTPDGDFFTRGNTSWDNQVELRKKWQVLQLLNVIER